ncbi:tRNA 2'-phosphotransferase 1-like isoform X2 [Asterias rubens]|uniref:tRNA 2'-phosphotransferase 1-like isoform X2 n=1 Tax=Asterias rubens TaxID=7604 RepID=UPI00145566AC|nr:tRNA 2'-phosphotransferase 1-like isoform X2 [Asterias rubens]
MRIGLFDRRPVCADGSDSECHVKIVVDMAHHGWNGRKDVHLSKTLTYVLRHKAVELGFNINSGGYVNVDDLLSHSLFRQYTLDDIKEAVANSDKQRFTLRKCPSSEQFQICANQGHSFVLPDLELTPITDVSQYPTVVHGTYLKFWDSIKTQGLSRMNRTHVHFAQGEPGESNVISGMRRSCEVMIFLNLEKALSAGLSFQVSKNGVILSSGDANGLIHPQYFKQVIKTRPRCLIFSDGKAV